MPRREDASPKSLGYKMPAEWEPHAATWLAWPHEPRDWPGKLAPIPWVYGEVVRHLAGGERVRILSHDAAVEGRARALLKRVGVDAGRVDFLRAPTDRSWTRDSCPLFVTDAAGEVAVTNWRFNGWAKYPNHKRDDALPDRIARRYQLRQWKPTVEIEGQPWRVVLEGGAVDVNGAGTLLATEECLLDSVQARNPGLSRQGLEAVLALPRQLGIGLQLRCGLGGGERVGIAPVLGIDLGQLVQRPQLDRIAAPDDRQYLQLAHQLGLAEFTTPEPQQRFQQPRLR